MPRRDGSDRGDEWIHYQCGLPWSDHTWGSDGKGSVRICPDDPQGVLGKLDRLRPSGHPEPGPNDDDGAPIPAPPYYGPTMDEVFQDWYEENFRDDPE